MQTNTTTPTLSIDMLRQLAFMQFNDEPFFYYDGKFWQGYEKKLTNDFGKWLQSDVNTGKTDYLTLTEWLGQNASEVEEFNDDDYLVLTDEEADEKTKEYIEQSVWAFTPSFLADQTNVPMEMFEALQANDKCESNNDAILNCIDDLDDFVQAAISADGRGHFLSSYDGNENEETITGIINEDTDDDKTTFYIYRTN